MSTPISDPNGTDNQTELKPCPFCGEVPRNRTRDTLFHQENGCLLSGQVHWISAWNKRAEISVSEGKQGRPADGSLSSHRDNGGLGLKEPPSATTSEGQMARYVISAKCSHDAAFDLPCGPQRCPDCGEPLTVGCEGNDGRCPVCTLSSVPGATENQGQAPVSQNSESPSLPASKAGEETWQTVYEGNSNLHYVCDANCEPVVDFGFDRKDDARAFTAAHNASLSGLKEADVTAQSLGEKEA